MSVLAECPYCRTKQSVKNKLCKCGAELEKLKRRSKKVKYWIAFRLPGGKQRREPVGYSIEEAKDADGKRRVQKRENRIFDMLPESKMTFDELSKWYLSLSSVTALASYRRVKIILDNFNKVFGTRIIGTIKQVDLEDYQTKRKEDGLKPSTIDAEIAIVKTMVTKAFDNDKLDGRALKAFRRVKRKLKRGSNARKRTISFEEYLKLVEEAAQHFKGVIIVAYNTGMRSGELQKLRWSHIDRKEMFIRLPEEITKEGKAKDIPINHNVKSVLDALPRALRHDFVFTYKGNPMTHKNGFVHPFKSTCKRAELPYGRDTVNGIIFRDTRRTVKTNMLNAGVDKVYRDLILGHSLAGMDVHYMAPNEETLKQAMAKFTHWLDENLEKSVQLLTKPLTKAS